MDDAAPTDCHNKKSRLERSFERTITSDREAKIAI
jgi:hypothetical protein